MGKGAEFARALNMDDTEEQPQIPFPEGPDPIPGQYEIEFPEDTLALEHVVFMTEADVIAAGDAAFARFEANEITEAELDAFLAQLLGPATVEAPLSFDELKIAEELGAMTEAYMPNIAA